MLGRWTVSFKMLIFFRSGAAGLVDSSLPKTHVEGEEVSFESTENMSYKINYLRNSENNLHFHLTAFLVIAEWAVEKEIQGLNILAFWWWLPVALPPTHFLRGVINVKGQ